MSKSQYNLAALCELLMPAFSDEELNAFCQSYFYDVYDNFALGMSKRQKVLALIDYCRRRNEMEKLLARVWEHLGRDHPLYTKAQALQESFAGLSDRAAEPRDLPPVPSRKQDGSSATGLLGWFWGVAATIVKFLAATAIGTVCGCAAGLMGGIWILILLLPSFPPPDIVLGDCAGVVNDVFWINLFWPLILLAGGLGGAVLGGGIVGGYNIVRIATPAMAKRAIFLPPFLSQIFAWGNILLIMALGGSMGGAVLGGAVALYRIYTIDVGTTLGQGVYEGVMTGMIAAALIGVIEGGSIALAISMGVAISEKLLPAFSLRLRLAIGGCVAGILAGFVSILLSGPGTDWVVGLASPFGGGDVSSFMICSLRFLEAVLMTGPVKWPAALGVGAIVGTFIAVSVGSLEVEN